MSFVYVLTTTESVTNAHDDRYDLATASDLKYFAIPDLQARLAELEKKEARRTKIRGILLCWRQIRK